MNTADGGNTNTNNNNTCQPATCATLGSCGMFPDGCGGTVSCTDGCECTDDDFDVVCPQRPCETLSGCDQGQCVYEPVICGGAICQPSTCTGDNCDVVCTSAGCDTGLYPCGGGTCAGVNQYCDPAPTVQDGDLVFQNACVGAPSMGCGTCDLGDLGCDDTADSFTCVDITVPVVDEGGIVECDSTVSASTFLFVDTEYTDGNSDGSRARPFTSYDDALASALTRNTRGIVVAGSPVFTTPLRIEDGVSVYGGFQGAPSFDPDFSLRPVWQVGANHFDAANNRLVGATAVSITRGTVISHLRVQTADIETLNDGVAGATNIALLARGAAALHIQDVELTAGSAGAGVAGRAGAEPTAAHDGTNATGRLPGQAGGACPTTCTLNTSIPRQDTAQCGHGAYGAAPGFSWDAPNRGNPGTANGSVAGGAGGANSGNPGSGCNANNSATTPGQRGAPGRAGAAGDDGMRGTRGSLNEQGVWQPGNGTDGTAGGTGTWGGGGGAGGGLYDDCFNEPRYGGHGGGAGGPGCGGDFGSAGGGGGASIGLAALLSDGLSTELTTIVASAGGRGGDGGAGKDGGTGGAGETNLMPLCAVREGGGEGICQELGGEGGDGGPGGRGGSGGAGAGGDSIGVFCVGQAISVAEVQTTVGPGGNAGIGASASLTGEAGAALDQRGCQ